MCMTNTEDIISTPVPARPAPRSTASYVNDLADVGKAPKVLDALRSELGKKVKRPDVYLEVPERPNMAVRFSPNVTQHQIRAWRRNSGEETKAGLDSTKFACYVLANTCSGLMLDNEMVVNEDGVELVFGDEAIVAMVGAKTVSDTIKAIYVVEPHIEAVALAIMEAAGFSDSVEQVDPTKGS